MAPRQPLKLTGDTVDALLPSSRDTGVWDRDFPGFGLRTCAAGRKARCTDPTPDRARWDVAVVIDRTKRNLGPDPSSEAPEPTAADLAERYMESHVGMNCLPSTIRTFGHAVRSHIVPEPGHLLLSEVGHVSSLTTRCGTGRVRPIQR